MMEQIVSLVVANGLWAVLFCGLLVYQLRDSRSREAKYTQTIRTLSDRLDVVRSVASDAEEIHKDTAVLRADMAVVRADTDKIKRAVTTVRGRGKCAIDQAT